MVYVYCRGGRERGGGGCSCTSPSSHSREKGGAEVVSVSEPAVNYIAPSNPSLPQHDQQGANRKASHHQQFDLHLLFLEEVQSGGVSLIMKWYHGVLF